MTHDTESYVTGGANISGHSAATVRATEDSVSIVSAAGSFSTVDNREGGIALAASVATNQIDRNLRAYVGSREWNRRISESKFADVEGFGRNRYGKIMLTDHRSEVWYRNIVLTPLPPPVVAVAAGGSSAGAGRCTLSQRRRGLFSRLLASRRPPFLRRSRCLRR